MRHAMLCYATLMVRARVRVRVRVTVRVMARATLRLTVRVLMNVTRSNLDYLVTRKDHTHCLYILNPICFWMHFCKNIMQTCGVQ